MIRKAMNVIADHLADHAKSPILIICQVKGKRQTKDEKLGPYQEYLSKLAREVEEIKFTHLGMEGKHFVDTLVTLTSMARIDFGHKVQPVHIDIRNNPSHGCSVEREIDGNPWYYDIKNFIQKTRHIPWGHPKSTRRL
jgi:hypothetical protein